MSDVDPSVRFDLCTVLVPGSSDVLVRHLTFEDGLILCFHSEVGDALVDLQLFFYPVRKTEDQTKQTGMLEGKEIHDTNLTVEENIVTVDLSLRFSIIFPQPAVSKQPTQWE